MNIKLSDYIAQRLVELGVEQVFMVTGGGAMHLNQSLGRHNGLNCIFNHHEQACAMAAESYSRLTHRPALVNVTTGPGGTNAITGVHGAWTDSLSMLVISGQVKYQTTIQSTGMSLRQYGDQEIDICKIVHSITKYSQMISDPSSIRYHLEKAFYLATHGRPGPCWLDVPIDVQSSFINPDELVGFNPEELEHPWLSLDLLSESAEIISAIELSERPVILAGSGVRISRSYEPFLQLIDRFQVPVVTGWNAHDLLPDEHSLYVGRPGTVGNRSGNFVIQNADLILILGCRLNIRQISYNWTAFAPKAYKIMVDIDELEMQKPSLIIDKPIQADLADLIPFLLQQNIAAQPKHRVWLDWCKDRLKRYPVVLKEYWNSSKVNPYCFMDTFFKMLSDDQIVVAANGSACVIGFQAAVIKSKTRLWTNSGSASMGYELPAAIGASYGAPAMPIVCFAGDGSIMMNLQELETIVGNKLPIKIFILNNAGYSSIYQTQKNFFDGVEVGASRNSGVTFPKFESLSKGFGLPYFKCDNHASMESTIKQVMVHSGPVICELILDDTQAFSPKLASKQLSDGSIVSPSLEDMSPFLSQNEMAENIWKSSEK
ncbi:thiamine pyrophosphate-binding protein [Shewanella scandinavica]|uniref:thiamine pyrophosphate-binding protein n=1 Tax=Shewanella scandinavica TaxID=3063538 RepID=UPI00318D5E7F